VRNASVFENASIEPFADQSQQHSIPCPTLEKVAKVAVVNRIKELTNVHIHDPAPSHGHRLLPETRQRLMRRSPGPEAVRAVLEVLFVDGFQRHDDRPLEYLILEGRDTHSALPPHPDHLRDLSPLPIRIIPFGASVSRSFEFVEGAILTLSSSFLTGATPPLP
jgi:hypothetical protein